MVKALREAKVRSAWTDPDEEYEASLTAMVRQLALSSCEGFGVEAAAWAVRIGHAAATTSLALTVLKTICPGVPDVYQGNELWEFALTDPDNRRPVDFEHLRHLLAELPKPDACHSLLDTWTDGRIKLHVLRTLLALRRQQPELLQTGGVERLAVSGSLRDHVIALARLHHDGLIVAIVPRLLRRAGSVGTFPLGRSLWDDTAVQLPAGHPTQLKDVLSGRLHAPRHGSIPVGDLLGTLPVAVLFGTT
jgi:(1->4)-alpha-D-glucan 1-alpha-D-glucosylmutase